MTAPLFLSAEEELKAFGQNLRIARKRRKVSITDLAQRLAMDRRVIDKIEKGDPTVSLGSFIQVLDFFGMLKGLSLFASPEHDVEGILLEARSLRKSSRTKKGKAFSKDELDF